MKKLLLAGLFTTGLTMTLPALAADEFNVRYRVNSRQVHHWP